ncbi:putative vacuolar protein sorting-associated protein 13A [Cinnamomum micranthum f. kanehirae]|uniref:Putative vacuolar protein sorting-associated protein 13A n=1 Tax=Cinnamomum micranthum f. kanehirae TaxID=337451 RepID=A0A3S3N778_9MAGN|nr:putative vacuolar protein sorting-associated protein 13A [Cinnamomum micranthum f. kanehirae]
MSRQQHSTQTSFRHLIYKPHMPFPHLSIVRRPRPSATGYLGRYVKDLQLKIGLLNEEVLLENVELILEAFDYLQPPFALKQGRVGKLSIKNPWKKLGWDPIIISLEDVFICACQRDDDEWSLELWILFEKEKFLEKRPN